MKRMKRAMIVGLAIMCTMMTVSAKTVSTSLVIDGKSVVCAVKPYINQGTTLVPLRVISENLGASVNYNKANQTITIKKADTTIELVVGKYQVKVNGISNVLSQAPIVKNGTTMVPIRFISESLTCEVNFNPKTGVVSVTSNGTGGTTGGGGTGGGVILPTITEDAWGRKVRTTGLPKNANLFPYIVEGVPNWCYEQQPWNDNYWGWKSMANKMPQYRKLASSPKMMVGQGSEFSDFMTKYHDMLDETINAQLNFDYRTVNEDNFVNIMAQNINPHTVSPQGVDKIKALAREYLDYAKKYKVAMKAEYEILPETLWRDGDTMFNSVNVSVWVKLTPISVPDASSGKRIDDFGTIASSFGSGKLEVGKTYEGIVTYTLSVNANDKFQVNYRSMEAICQLSPKIDLLNGVSPNMKDKNRQEKFQYGWAPKDTLYSRYQLKITSKDGQSPIVK